MAEITGGPEGNVMCYWAVDEGRLEARAEGTVDGPDVTLTLSWKDAASLCRGDLDAKCRLHAGTVEGRRVDGCDDLPPHRHENA